MFEVFFNSVENSSKTYGNDRDLFNGLEQDFNVPFPESYKIVYEICKQMDKVGNGAEYCDNDITVIFRRKEHN